MDKTQEIVMWAILREMRAAIEAQSINGEVPDDLETISQLVDAAHQVMSRLPIGDSK